MYQTCSWKAYMNHQMSIEYHFTPLNALNLPNFFLRTLLFYKWKWKRCSFQDHQFCYYDIVSHKCKQNFFLRRYQQFSKIIFYINVLPESKITQKFAKLYHVWSNKLFIGNQRSGIHQFCSINMYVLQKKIIKCCAAFVKKMF